MMWLFRRDILLEFENNHGMNLVQKHSLCKQTKYSFRFFPHQLTRFKIQSHFVGKRVFISRKFKYLNFQFTVRLTHSRISPNSLKSEKKTDRNFLAKIYWFDLLSSDYCVYVCVCVVCVHRRLVNIYQFLDGGFFSLL